MVERANFFLRGSRVIYYQDDTYTYVPPPPWYERGPIWWRRLYGYLSTKVIGPDRSCSLASDGARGPMLALRADEVSRVDPAEPQMTATRLVRQLPAEIVRRWQEGLALKSARAV